MFFSHLTLRNFGSFEFCELSFQPRGLTVIHGPNGSGKTQIKGALLAAVLGRAAVTTDTSGAGPTDVRVSLQEYDDKEELYLTVTLNERGNPVLKHSGGASGAHSRSGRLAALLRKAISARSAPKILLQYDDDSLTAPFLNTELVERVLPNDLRDNPTWLRLKDSGGSENFSHSGSSRAMSVLLSEFAERRRHGNRLPLIIDQFHERFSQEDSGFCTRILESIAEQSQVILFTSQPSPSLKIDLLDHVKSTLRTLTYYNGAADRQRPYRPRATARSADRLVQEDDAFIDMLERKEFVLDPNEPVVLLLGPVTREGILSAVKSTGRQYKHRMLNSTPENWWSIVRFFDDYRISCVVGRVTEEICNLLLRSEYVSVRAKLFERLASVPTLVFAHEDIGLGEQRGPRRSGSFPTKESLEELLELFRAHEVQIALYRSLAEITVTASAFLEDRERNLIFRLYVPRGRIWSAEADKFLQLFQDYLSRIDQLRVRLDQKRTDHGTIYEFHGETPAGAENLAGEFQEFSKFMDLCAYDANTAAGLLAGKKLHSHEITRIVERYVKEARRLQLDIKHEAESKLISLRHRVESELIELEPSADEWKVLGTMVSAAVPQFGPLLPAPSTSLGIPARPGLVGQETHITYNIRPQFIHTVNGIVSEEMSGTQHFDADHRQLLEFIRAHAIGNPADLEAAVHELADNSGTQVGRLKATQKVKNFLIDSTKRLGKEAVNVGFEILHKIIEKKLGL